MKLVSYNKDEQDQLAILVDGLLYDTDLVHPDLPVTMSMFLNYWEDVYPATMIINKKLEEGKISRQQGIDNNSVEILAPVPHSTSFRSAMAFHPPIASQFPAEQAMPLDEFNTFPVFNFGNHNCFQGPGDVVCMPDHLEKLDFELQVCIVICKAGKNIKAADAGGHIGGFMIMNTLSARHFGTGEKVSGSVAANGKGFAIPIGPVLVTPDELEPFIVESKPGHTGNAYNLSMKCSVNGVQVSGGNTADMIWTFAEIIEEVSYGIQLYPGDIISSGPVTKGCFLELNRSGKLHDADYREQWLKTGDVVEMEIDGLGKLSNTIFKDEGDSSEDE